ncbi:MAG: hypothetical protein Q4D97_02530 [Eubacteriales bacterium]|nr:hypothetical protein [Eubacteriales bacterium]
MKKEVSLTSQEKSQLDQEKLLSLLVPSALLILVYALEVLMLTKDVGLFAAWQEAFPDLDFASYLNAHLFYFLGKILYPLALSLYTALTIKRYGTPSYYRMVWLLLGLGALVRQALEANFYSLFYYLAILCYLSLLWQLSRLQQREDNFQLRKQEETLS